MAVAVVGVHVSIAVVVDLVVAVLGGVVVDGGVVRRAVDLVRVTVAVEVDDLLLTARR